MVAFRRIILALAVVAAFASLASAQTTSPMNCVMTTFPNTIRQEGMADQVGDLTITCTGGSYLPGVNQSTGIAIPKINFTVQLGGINTITSRSTNSTGGVTDALLMIDNPGTTTAQQTFGGFGSDQAATVCDAPTNGSCTVTPYGYVANSGQPVMSGSNSSITPTAPNVYQGIVSGSSVTFFGVPILAPVSTGFARVFRITNVRVNATTAAAGSSVSAAVTFTGTNVSTLLSLQNNSLPVAIVQAGLNATNTKTVPTSTTICTNFGSATTGPKFIGSVQFAENFGAAFKTRTIGNATAGSSFSNDMTLQNVPGTYPSESGVTISLPGSSNSLTTNAGLADFGTRLKAVFSNIPAGVRLYVSASNVHGTTIANVPVAPGVIASNDTSEPYAELITGADTVVDGASGPALATGTSGGTPVMNWVEITPSSGSTATAVWEVVNANPTANENFDFSYALVFSANVPPVTGTTAVPTPTIAMSFAPTTGTGTIPLFANTDNLVGNAFTLSSCRTILLFPYLTSAAGFDTGVAISNTSTDPLGTSAQSGACTLNWYPVGANTASSTAAGTAITPTTTLNILSGTTYQGTLTVGFPTATGNTMIGSFTGYMIAVCQFQYAHGFAFVADWGNASTSSAMGYVALVIPDPLATSPTAIRANGTNGAGETLGQ